jgi:predicted FMN-binding regulatory protein PaiB
MMSASWDPEREGSVFGTDEFSRNIGSIKDGFSRSKDNAVVREQIMLEENFGKQKVSSSKSSKNNKKIAQSLAEKLGDGMD